MQQKSRITLAALGAVALVAASAAAQTDRPGTIDTGEPKGGTTTQEQPRDVTTPPEATQQSQGMQQGQGNTTQQSHGTTMPKSQSTTTPQGQGNAGTQGREGAQPTKLDKADKDFLNRAAESSLYEQMLGQLAQDRASSDDVKKLGQQLVSDHATSDVQLSQIFQQKGIMMPQGISQGDQAKLDRLSKLSGSEFDKAFVAEIMMDNKASAAVVETRSKGSKDTDVKGYATGLVDRDKAHTQAAKDVRAKLQNQKATPGTDTKVPDTSDKVPDTTP